MEPQLALSLQFHGAKNRVGDSGGPETLNPTDFAGPLRMQGTDCHTVHALAYCHAIIPKI